MWDVPAVKSPFLVHFSAGLETAVLRWANQAEPVAGKGIVAAQDSSPCALVRESQCRETAWIINLGKARLDVDFFWQRQDCVTGT